MKKRIVSALVSLCLVLSLLPIPMAQAAKTSFSDVRDDAYYADAVAWAIKQDITHGTTATTFSPNNTCTIAQITTFLWRACGSPEPGISENPFSDVQESHYSYKAALWAYENGITLSQMTEGDALKGKFWGSTNCQRYLVVYFLWRLNDFPASPTHFFDDVGSGSDNALAKAVSWAVENGITNGTSTTTFSPNNTCTRAQIVTFLYRADQAGVLSDGKPCMVVLNGNGGKFNLDLTGGAMSDDKSEVYWQITQGENYPDFSLMNRFLERDGYDFLGWYTAKDGGEQVTDNTVVTKSGPHTLYAHWGVKTGTVIDGVDVEKDARKIRENLYYICPAGDYSLYEKYEFERTVNAIYDEYVSLFQIDPLNNGVPLLIKLEKDLPYNETAFRGDGYRIQLSDYRDTYDEDYQEANGYDLLYGVFGPIHVYELGHEMMHFFIKYKQGCTDYPTWLHKNYQAWNEEVIAETMSLLLLHRLTEAQVKHPAKGYTLSRYLEELNLSRKYSQNDELLRDISSRRWTLEEFQELSEKAANHQTTHEYAAARYLYDVLLSYSDSDLAHLIELYDYYNPAGYIDYDRWEAAYGGSPNMISALKRIQPLIEG